MEIVPGCDFEHVKMNMGIFMPGKTYEPHLAGLPGFEHGFLRPAFREHAIRVLETDDLMVLNQIEMIGLQAA
jgi:hypothetical protein